MSLSGFILTLFLLKSALTSEETKFLDDICGHINGQRIYLDYGEVGTLQAKYYNNLLDKFIKNNSNNQKRCTVEFISCSSCLVTINFKFLNLSKNCGRSTVFDTCGCDYVWIYEPTFEQSSEQFCGHFIANNFSLLEYKSQTRKVIVEFLYNSYEHAFTLDYSSKRNQIQLIGFPKLGNINNSSQTITSPFFPNFYPTDLTMEHIISCESINETCRISLVFTDFLLAPSTIIDFFDWNNERIYVTTGNIFRPPVIVTSGPSLMIRFYANGASDRGFKAYYSFILGQLTEKELTPNIDCGGEVKNLGGGITMMDMLSEGLKSFDCIWLVKPPETFLHMKTHLYVKIINFSGFVGNTELVIRQGFTSNGPIVENLKLSLASFYGDREREHIVSISQGFYIRLKGFFRPESTLALVYAAFNYKECLAGSDFLCQNKRCISALLKCDGFDHCGDNSDEFTISCSKEPHDRREWSKTPHFFFPKVDGLSELATSTMIFLLCSFGLIGFIFAIIILLYRINIKSRHQRQIQNHIETINAILEEGVGVIEEEIIINDDPPDYEAPPDYDEALKTLPKSKSCNKFSNFNQQGTSRSCQTTPINIPDSPPPAYEIQSFKFYQKSNPCKILENLHLLSLKNSNCLCENFLLHAGRFICRRRCNKTKYFSDSELSQMSDFLLSDNVNFGLNIKKSFTTDDVNLFI